MRAALIALAAIAVVALIAVGLHQASSEDGAPAARPTAQPSRAAALERLAGSPPALAALHAQADELLPGGLPALTARLRSVTGHPAVVNVWASWCGPCIQEAPVLQEVSLDRGREVAFIGVDLKDSRSGAQGFLRRFPSSYPSYEDPDGKIFNHLRLAGAPATIFFDAAGEQQYIHQGPYLTAADLRSDIARYAVGKAGA
ncbi:unannotated protein [freshwater metagenome]|uniref:Unannotated protein n=1 Tax=freshwater metagenome TaxID=449393 RepID=A0A6J7H867_9ZZZZ|nr:redoxin family protein [Actinomycetota bacterium]